MWDSLVICLNNVLHKLRRRSASVGKSNKRQASSYGMLPTMIWRARRWTFSSVLDCSFVRLVCQAGHPYSRIGQTTVWKKYAISSLTTPARFNFFKNQICLAALDAIALTWSSHFNAALMVTPNSFYSVTCWTRLPVMRSGVVDSLLSGPRIISCSISCTVVLMVVSVNH